MNRGRHCKCPFFLYFDKNFKTWPGIVKMSHLGSSHRSGAELNSFNNTLGIKLLSQLDKWNQQVRCSGAGGINLQEFFLSYTCWRLAKLQWTFSPGTAGLLLPSAGLMEFIYVRQKFLEFFFPHNSSMWFCSLCLTRNTFVSCVPCNDGN